jgi:hypothetical protein
MSKACRIYGRDEKCKAHFSSEALKRIVHLAGLGVDERIILKLIL